jgi:hypothetical protein
VENDQLGYVTRCGSFAAVPFGDTQYIIIHNGQQIRCCKNLTTAKNYISLEMKKLK